VSSKADIDSGTRADLADVKRPLVADFVAEVDGDPGISRRSILKAAFSVSPAQCGLRRHTAPTPNATNAT
jgi:hypothetical protein